MHGNAAGVQSRDGGALAEMRPHLPTVPRRKRNVEPLDKIHDHHPLVTVCTKRGSVRVPLDLRGGSTVGFLDELVAARTVEEAGTAAPYDRPPNSRDRTLDRLPIPRSDPKTHCLWFVLAVYLVVRHALFSTLNRTSRAYPLHTPRCDHGSHTAGTRSLRSLRHKYSGMRRMILRSGSFTLLHEPRVNRPAQCVKEAAIISVI